MASSPPPRRSREDDPTGGRWLTRRLVRWLPVAALSGAVIGMALALAGGGGWGLVPLLAFAAVAVTGTILAAVEDGRVQRRVDRMTRRGD